MRTLVFCLAAMLLITGVKARPVNQKEEVHGVINAQWTRHLAQANGTAEGENITVNTNPMDSSHDNSVLLMFASAQNPKTVQQEFEQTLATIQDPAVQNLAVTGNVSTKVDEGTASNWGNDDLTGVQGLVLQPGETVTAEAAAAALAQVKPADWFALPNFNTYAAASVKQACRAPSIVSQGQEGFMTPNNWNKNCVNGRNIIKWYGRRCGADWSKIEYTHIVAYSSPGIIATDRNNKQGDYRGLCVMTKYDTQTKTAKTRRFGNGCGKLPSLNSQTQRFASCVDDSFAASECVQVAALSATSNQAQNVQQSIVTTQAVTCLNGRYLPAGTSMRLSGLTCGPDNKLINWQVADDGDGCTFYSSSIFGRDLPRTAAMLGLGCGSAAQAASKVCPPPITQCQDSPFPNIYDEPPTAATEVPMGVARIYRKCLPVLATINANEQFVVAVADSGVDRNHDDINLFYIPGFGTGKNMGVQASDKFPLDDDPNVDYYGHGTHVAGTVAAKGGNGTDGQKRVVGMSPGARVISLKVLDGAGSGKMSSMLNAANWLATEAVDKGVRVAVFSLTLYMSPDAPYFENAKTSICAPFQAASDRGVIIVAAAGNNKASMRGFFPAACPTVIAVTALNTPTDGPAVAFSNYLDLSTATDDDIQTTMAAPGSNINSTIPRSIVSSGYMTLYGTSMAAPHIAGVAANCLMSKACDPGKTGREHIDVIREAAKTRLRLTGPGYGPYTYRGDPTSPLGSQYYGYLTWQAF